MLGARGSLKKSKGYGADHEEILNFVGGYSRKRPMLTSLRRKTASFRTDTSSVFVGSLVTKAFLLCGSYPLQHEYGDGGQDEYEAG